MILLLLTKTLKICNSNLKQYKKKQIKFFNLLYHQIYKIKNKENRPMIPIEIKVNISMKIKKVIIPQIMNNFKNKYKIMIKKMISFWMNTSRIWEISSKQVAYCQIIIFVLSNKSLKTLTWIKKMIIICTINSLTINNMMVLLIVTIKIQNKI